MKILHIGGRPFITFPLAMAQRSEGHEVDLVYPDNWAGELLSPWFLDGIESLVSKEYSVIHFHRPLAVSLLGTSVEQRLDALKNLSRKSKLFYSSYDDFESVWDPLGSGPEIRKSFSHIFLGSTKHSKLLENADRVSWCSIAVAVEEIPAPPIEEPTPHSLKVLYIAKSPVSEEASFINGVFNKLKKKQLKFENLIFHATEIRNLGGLTKLMRNADLFVEELGGYSFGSLATLALAHGTSVLSGNTARDKQCVPTLSYAPVLDTNAANFEQRLEKIIKEPRSLRDLGKRSRTYAESYCDARTACHKVTDI